tara:strand:+ start:177 stop:1148 length:972 start_codon:yes stop_codon:yes gene_type:complete
MKKTIDDIKILPAKDQMLLYGYDRHFNFFINLFNKKKYPQMFLLSGSKGSGKSTFIYHFINYLLSKNEKNPYSLNDFSINENNTTYKLLKSGTHPNFFLIENSPSDKEIKIDQVKELIKFLNKSTYSRELKIVMIDDAECLNFNSSSALLKAIEEPSHNTIFFIIHNGPPGNLHTIKSRCVEFKFFFTTQNKKNIYNKIVNQYSNLPKVDKIIDSFYFDTAGNLLKYVIALSNSKINILEDKLSCALFFIEKYKNNKNLENLSFVTLFVQNYYNELCANEMQPNRYYLNHSKILKQLSNMKRFNLNDKNIFIWMYNLLINEKK